MLGKASATPGISQHHDKDTVLGLIYVAAVHGANILGWRPLLPLLVGHGAMLYSLVPVSIAGEAALLMRGATVHDLGTWLVLYFTGHHGAVVCCSCLLQLLNK